MGSRGLRGPRDQRGTQAKPFTAQIGRGTQRRARLSERHRQGRIGAGWRTSASSRLCWVLLEWEVRKAEEPTGPRVLAEDA